MSRRSIQTIDNSKAETESCSDFYLYISLGVIILLVAVVVILVIILVKTCYTLHMVESSPSVSGRSDRKDEKQDKTGEGGTNTKPIGNRRSLLETESDETGPKTPGKRSKTKYGTQDVSI